jgi:hypothetical protein
MWRKDGKSDKTLSVLTPSPENSPNTPLHTWISILAALAVFAALQRRRGAPADLLFVGGCLPIGEARGIICASVCRWWS